MRSKILLLEKEEALLTVLERVHDDCAGIVQELSCSSKVLLMPVGKSNDFGGFRDVPIVEESRKTIIKSSYKPNLLIVSAYSPPLRQQLRESVPVKCPETFVLGLIPI